MRHEVRTKAGACLLIGLLALPSPVAAAELRPEAARGFELYVEATERRIRGEVQPGGAFLWFVNLPEARRREAEARLRQGEVVIERMEAEKSGGSIATPGALLHHWMGTVLIPGATLARVLSTIQNYDRHHEYYAPEVVKSRTIEHRGDDFRIYLRLKRVKVVTAVFDTEHQVRYHQLDATRAYSESRGTRIAELKDPGEAGERVLPEGEGRGFLWRLNSYWRFYQAPEGVYVQCEAVSLSRDIPTGLGWLIGPFVKSIPKESLEFTLQSTRAAVLGEINETRSSK